MEKEKEEIPNLEEREEAKEEGSDTQESSEEEADQSKVQLVTNEQLLHMKLDNLSADVQTLASQTSKLVEIISKNK